jgi:23S rRNA (cytosine1962-C5)-methyltransferase
LIVCDPPSFASSQSKQYAALRAYVRLNALGLSLVEPGGLYAAASCTAQVSPEAFRHTLAQAAERARVRLQIIHDMGQPVDHPIFVGHPEGRYLKFVVARVLGPV